jgi:hypothetical protein
MIYGSDLISRLNVFPVMKNVPDFLERTIIHVNVFSFRYMVLMRVGDFQTKLSRFIRLCTGFLVSVVLVEKSVIF